MNFSLLYAASIGGYFFFLSGYLTANPGALRSVGWMAKTVIVGLLPYANILALFTWAYLELNDSDERY